MKIWTRLARIPLKAVGAIGGVALKVVPGSVKLWAVEKVAGVVASKAGGALRDQVKREKTMSETTTAGTKPGFKTTEFWLTALTQAIGLAYQAGVIHDGTAFGKIISLVVMALTAAGYSIGRGVAKSKTPAGITIETFGDTAKP